MSQAKVTGHQRESRSIPGAGDILGAPDAARAPSGRGGVSPDAFDPPAGPGLVPQEPRSQPSANADDSQAAKIFVDHCQGSIGRAREALDLLLKNPALEFVVRVGSPERAREALDEFVRTSG